MRNKKLPILIGTSIGYEDWVADCLVSVQTWSGDVVVKSDSSYELGKIRWAYEHLDWDRFLFLQCTTVVNDQSILDELDWRTSHGESYSIGTCPGLYGSYLGVYQRHVLDTVGVPDVTCKEDSIRKEVEWTREYVRHAPTDMSDVPAFTHLLTDEHGVKVMRHGQVRLEIATPWITKWKATYR